MRIMEERPHLNPIIWDLVQEVGEKVMGWKLCGTDAGDLFWTYADTGRPLYHNYGMAIVENWNPVHRMDAAWTVVMRMRTLGYHMFLYSDEYHPSTRVDTNVWFCWFGTTELWEDREEDSMTVLMDTAIEDILPGQAICRAALSALERPN